jgi:protein MAK11
VTTISSDGKILVYDLGSLPSTIPEATSDVLSISPIGEYDTKGSRLICLTLAEGGEEGGGAVTGKRKRGDHEDEYDEYEDGEGGGDEEEPDRGTSDNE